HPEELVEISQPRRATPMMELREAKAFSGIAAYYPANFPVASSAGSKLVFSVRVNDNLFRVLGVTPIIGRDFSPGDEQQPVVILGYDYWRQNSGKPEIIGQTLTVGGENRTVIGVLPADFTLFFRDGNLWVPQSMNNGNARVLARLNPGVSLQKAE